MDTETQRSNLQYLARFAGWGEPRSDLWFVALEEGSEANADYVLKIKSLEAECGDPALAGLIVERPPTGQVQDDGPGRSTTERAEKEIVERLLGDRAALGSWRNLRFHANLNCLGYNRSQMPFPVDIYGDLAGVRSLDDEHYRDAQEQRWRALRTMRELLGVNGPKAVVCLGLAADADFRRALTLSVEPEKVKAHGRRLLVFESARTIIAPHPSYGNLRRVQDRLIDQLADWGVLS